MDRYTDLVGQARTLGSIAACVQTHLPAAAGYLYPCGRHGKLRVVEIHRGLVGLRSGCKYFSSSNPR